MHSHTISVSRPENREWYVLDSPIFNSYLNKLISYYMCYLYVECIGCGQGICCSCQLLAEFKKTLSK